MICTLTDAILYVNYINYAINITQDFEYPSANVQLRPWLWRPRKSWGFGALLKGLTSVVVLKVEESAGFHSKIKMAW